jgi:uncharacterized protein
MKSPVIVDTGPLVAILDENDSYKEWVRDRMSRLPGPLFTCESVLSETFHLLRKVGGRGTKNAVEMLRDGDLILSFSASTELDALLRLTENYGDVPMSFADACLVRMSELMNGSVVFTLDSDFKIYRKNRRERIPLIIPN